MTYKTRLTTAIATGAVLLNALAPMAFANTITVTGNGASSLNSVNLSSNTTTVVNQTNNLNVNNDVDAKATTGGNSANYNTGGNVTVNTGAANTSVNVSTAANVNKANVDCCNKGGATNVTVDGNGAKSLNAVDLNKDKTIVLSQDNNAYVTNDVNAKADTGKNDASFNTDGNVTINTGKATTNVSVDTKANANVAKIGGGQGASNGDTVTITENGVGSANFVGLGLSSAIVLAQDNAAKINNDVDAKANSGKNDATFNTGGEVTINTGAAKTNVDVNNLVNFNAADVDCGCLLDGVDVKIGKNGVGSDNEVAADLSNGLWVAEGNAAALNNDVDGNAKTGKNDASFNTGDPSGDPSVVTGAADSQTDVSNAGNVNLYNQGATLHLPGDWNFDFQWDLHGLLGFLGGTWSV